MSEFKYKVIEQVNSFGSTMTKEYSGFSHVISKANVKNHILVIAWLDGEVEYWIVEKDIKSLSEYYMDMVGIIPEFTEMRHVDRK